MVSTPLSHQFEEYVQYAEIKQLAYTIAALQQKKLFRTLAVLSCLPEEGKTLTCATLAMAYSDVCQTKVLVVDATSRRNSDSLELRSCLNGSAPLIELQSLKDYKQKSVASMTSRASTSVLEPSVVDGHIPRVTRDNQFSSLKQLTEEPSPEYGLILFDTVPLLSRNKGNIDPMLVARLSSASILIVSRAFLDSAQLNASLKILRDPTLHLVGIISNERRTS